MARAGTAKSKINNEGVRVDINTNQPFNPSVSASDLANPPSIPNIPAPKVPTAPSSFVENLSPTIENSRKQFVEIQSEEKQKRDDILNRLLKNEGKRSEDVFQNEFDTQIQNISGEKSPEFLKRLADENERLALLRGKFRSAGERISSGGRGQSKVFEDAQLSELSREEAVQVGNQALLVQALQGNYETAKEIALETANFAFQDRQFELQNLSAQFEAVQGIVDSQEQQAIQRELADLEELRSYVSAAISSGVATPEEMQQLTSLDLPDDQKKALAQSITSRGAQSDRELSDAAKRASIYSSNLSARKSLIELAGLGDPEAIDTLGYDPNNLPLTQQEIAQNEDLYAGTLEDIARVEDMLNTKSAIGGTTGQIQNRGLLSLGGIGALFSGEQGFAAGLGGLPVAGNISQGIAAKNEQDNFLNNAQYIIKNLTFEKFADLKEKGVSLTPVSNVELAQIAQSSAVIASMAEYDESGTRLVGFRGSEEQLRSELAKIKTSYYKVQDELNAQIGLTEDERDEINSIK